MKNFWNKFRDFTPIAFIISVAFLLPMHKHIIQVLLIIWGVFSLFTYRWGKYIRHINRSLFPVVPLILMYFLSIMALLLFTENTDAGLFKLEVKLSFIIFPLLLLPLVLFTSRQVRYLLLAFVVGCFLSDLICLGNSVLNYPEIGASAFYYTSLSMFHHASYFAMYHAFAIVILFFDYLYYSERKLKLVYSGLILFLSVFIFLLSSKAGLIVLMIEFLALGLIILTDKFSFGKLMGVVAIVALCGILLASNYRVVSTTHQLVTKAPPSEVPKDSAESTQARILVWNASVKVISENWLYGTSPGDASDKLVQKYHQLGFSQAELKKLNCHNQYLEVLISLGIIGFLIFISIFLIPVSMYGFTRNLPLIFLLGITGINFLFESMLETQSGIIFFAFFYIIFIYSFKNKQK